MYHHGATCLQAFQQARICEHCFQGAGELAILFYAKLLCTFENCVPAGTRAMLPIYRLVVLRP